MPENSLPRERATLGNRGLHGVSSTSTARPCADCGAVSTVSTVSRVNRSSHREVFATLVPEALPDAARNGASSVDAQITDLARQWSALIRTLGPGTMPVSAIWHVSEPVDESRLALPLDSSGAGSPSVTVIVQPICCVTCQVSLELQLIVSASDALAVPVDGNGSARPASVHVLQDASGNRHIRVANISAPHAPESAANECEQVFERAEALLQKHGARLEDVVRTWLYLRHMERDYDALNSARCQLFDRRGLEVFPASTGIGGALPQDARDLCLSLYAIVSGGGRLGGLSRKEMRSDTFNGPWEYGSYFARGMRVDTRDGATLLLSGTAAIDAAGETVGVGDFDVQLDRTLENLRGLLRGADADFHDVVQMTSYLKSAFDRDRLRSRLESTGLLSVPHVVVEAEVCRPELLVECELIACV